MCVCVHACESVCVCVCVHVRVRMRVCVSVVHVRRIFTSVKTPEGRYIPDSPLQRRPRCAIHTYERTELLLEMAVCTCMHQPCSHLLSENGGQSRYIPDSPGIGDHGVPSTHMREQNCFLKWHVCTNHVHICCLKMEVKVFA